MREEKQVFSELSDSPVDPSEIVSIQLVKHFQPYKILLEIKKIVVKISKIEAIDE